MILRLSVEAQGKHSIFTVPFVENLTEEQFITNGALNAHLKDFLDKAIARLRSDVLKEMMKEKQ